MLNVIQWQVLLSDWCIHVIKHFIMLLRSFTLYSATCTHEINSMYVHNECSTDWAIWLPDTLSPQWWLSPNHDTHPHKFEICRRISELIFTARRFLRLTKLEAKVPHWATNVTGQEKCAVRLGLEPGTPCLQGECSTNWAIWLPDTLSPLWWLSPYHDISTDVHINKVTCRTYMYVVLKPSQSQGHTWRSRALWRCEWHSQIVVHVVKICGIFL